MRRLLILFLIMGEAFGLLGEDNVGRQDAFYPGQLWKDTDGKPINAHGGGIFYEEGIYYWYGEHKLEGRSEEEKADGGVHCYSSSDLYNWKDEGVVLPVEDPQAASDIAAGCILERPKVLFNRQTQQYVMFFKLYLPGKGYDTGYVGVAIARNPKGPFRYSHKFLGAGSPKGSGDFCMFQEENGNVYHLTVRKPDKAFCIGRLRADYLYPEGAYKVLEEIPPHTEAPAVVYRDGSYYMLGSGSTGWKPNAARSFSTKNLWEGYKDLGNPCVGINPLNGLGPEKSFGGQISFILKDRQYPEHYVALFDLWNPEHPIEGRYVWLPLRWKAGRMVIEWKDAWRRQE